MTAGQPAVVQKAIHFEFAKCRQKSGKLELPRTHINYTGLYGENTGSVRVTYGLRTGWGNPGFQLQTQGLPNNIRVCMVNIRGLYGLRTGSTLFKIQTRTFFLKSWTKLFKPVLKSSVSVTISFLVLWNSSNNLWDSSSKFFGDVGFPLLRYFEGCSSPQIEVQVF